MKVLNSEKHDNREIEKKGKMVERPEHSVKVTQECEKIIRSNKKNIVWLAY